MQQTCCQANASWYQLVDNKMMLQGFKTFFNLSVFVCLVWGNRCLWSAMAEFEHVTFGLHSKKRANCNKSAAGLLPCSHQDDIRMRSHRLLRLDDNKSAASCQQAWCKLIVKTFYPRAWRKLTLKCYCEWKPHWAGWKFCPTTVGIEPTTSGMLHLGSTDWGRRFDSHCDWTKFSTSPVWFSLRVAL